MLFIYIENSNKCWCLNMSLPGPVWLGPGKLTRETREWRHTHNPAGTGWAVFTLLDDLLPRLAHTSLVLHVMKVCQGSGWWCCSDHQYDDLESFTYILRSRTVLLSVFCGISLLISVFPMASPAGELITTTTLGRILRSLPIDGCGRKMLNIWTLRGGVLVFTEKVCLLSFY